MQTNELLKLFFGLDLIFVLVYIAVRIGNVFETRCVHVPESEIEEYILHELHLHGDSTLDEIKLSMGRLSSPKQLERIISKLIQEKKITSPFKRNGSDIFSLSET